MSCGLDYVLGIAAWVRIVSTESPQSLQGSLGVVIESRSFP